MVEIFMSVNHTDNKLYAVMANHFYAGIIVNRGVIIQAAPILKWSIGQSFDNFRLYCRKKFWAIGPEIKPLDHQL